MDSQRETSETVARSDQRPIFDIASHLRFLLFLANLSKSTPCNVMSELHYFVALIFEVGTFAKHEY